MTEYSGFPKTVPPNLKKAFRPCHNKAHPEIIAAAIGAFESQKAEIDAQIATGARAETAGPAKEVSPPAFPPLRLVSAEDLRVALKQIRLPFPGNGAASVVQIPLPAPVHGSSLELPIRCWWKTAMVGSCWRSLGPQTDPAGRPPDGRPAQTVPRRPAAATSFS